MAGCLIVQLCNDPWRMLTCRKALFLATFGRKHVPCCHCHSPSLCSPFGSLDDFTKSSTSAEDGPRLLSYILLS